MGPLANQRHERFAQALAQGKTATEAYVLAGYKAGNASRMKGNERISARVSGDRRTRCGAGEVQRVAENAPRWPDVKLVTACGGLS